MNKEKVSSSLFLPIVGDGGLASTDIGEGRIIPVLILDLSQRRDFYNLILIHKDTPPGDVLTTWALKRFDKKHLYLKIEFSRPAELEAYICFKLEKYAGLVEGIMRSRAMYLQPQESGKKVSDGMNEPKILVEVAAELEKWPRIYQESIETKYRKMGSSRKASKMLAQEHMSRMAEIWGKRMRRPEGQDT